MAGGKPWAAPSAIKHQVLLAMVSAVFLLSGCATLNPSWSPSLEPRDTVVGAGEIQSVNLEARLGVRDGSSSDTAHLSWNGDFAHQHVEILSPLGSVVAVLEHDPLHSRMTLSDGRVLEAADPSSLSNDALGYTLPLEGLPWWLLGQAQPGSAAIPVRDGAGVLLQQQQSGWLICYDHWRKVGDVSLPGQVKLTRGPLEMRWVIDQWHLTRK